MKPYLTKHDQVSVLPVHAMAGVGAVTRLVPHITNMLHDLVLSLPRHFVARKNYLEVPPKQILFDLFPDEVLNGG